MSGNNHGNNQEAGEHMSREGQAYAQEVQRERATRLATDLIRAHHDDPEAWARLLVSAGTGDETV